MLDGKSPAGFIHAEGKLDAGSVLFHFHMVIARFYRLSVDANIVGRR